MTSNGEVPHIGVRQGRENYGFSEMTTEELAARWEAETAPRPGTCSCPVFEDGVRGFRKSCEVHGRRDRGDFARLTALRVEMFSRMKQPASVKAWGKDRSS